MGKIYRVANGFEFDIDGYVVSNYMFFDNLDDARDYCNNVANQTGQILAIKETDENFVRFYNKRIGRE